MATMTDWYEQNIEEGIRETVRLLRDNGINTTSSCQHVMAIEAENYESSEIEKIYNLLIERGFDGFTIEVALTKEKNQSLRRGLFLRFHKYQTCEIKETGPGWWFR